MIRGTTAQFKFKLPYKKDEVEWITIKFWQPNNSSKLLPITRTKDDCDWIDDSTELVVSLTSEETSRFLDKYKAKVQIRGLCSETGTVFGNRPQLITVYPMDDDIINENPLLPSPSKEGWFILDGKSVVG